MQPLYISFTLIILKKFVDSIEIKLAYNNKQLSILKGETLEVKLKFNRKGYKSL